MQNHHSNLSRLQNVSSRFRLLLTVLIVLIPVTTLVFWIFFNSVPDGFKAGLPVKVKTELPPFTLLLGYLISLIPLSATLYGATNLKKLFGLYEQGIVFAEQNVRCFQHIGYALVALVPANIISTMLISLLLNFDKPFGTRVIFQFSSYDIAFLVIGAVIVLVSWVMKEAVLLEDEQAHTV